MVNIRSTSSLGFAKETTAGTPPATLTKWMGWQDGDVTLADPKYEVEQYVSTGQAREYARNRAKTAELSMTWPIVVGHAYPWYLGLGTSTTTVDVPAVGKNTHRLTVAKTLPSITVHRILGDDAAGVTNAINYVGGYVNGIEASLEERQELKGSLDLMFLQPTKTGTDFEVNAGSAVAQPITADKAVDSFTSDMVGGATGAVETGGDVKVIRLESDTGFGTDEGAGVTATGFGGTVNGTLFKNYSWSLKNDLEPIFAGRGDLSATLKGQFPVKLVPGIAKHEFTFGFWPENTTYLKPLVLDKKQFDFRFRVTRATNDYIEFRHFGCRVTDPGSSFPPEGKIPVELTAIARSTTVVEVNGNATIDADV